MLIVLARLSQSCFGCRFSVGAFPWSLFSSLELQRRCAVCVAERLQAVARRLERCSCAFRLLSLPPTKQAPLQSHHILLPWHFATDHPDTEASPSAPNVLLTGLLCNRSCCSQLTGAESNVAPHCLVASVENIAFPWLCALRCAWVRTEVFLPFPCVVRCQGHTTWM